jgi:F420-dependent oxidoreductase-like protein
MDLRIMIEPQEGASYDTQLRLARAAEELGFSGFFRSDHYHAMGGDGLPGPTDAWVTLAGLARETSTIRLGTMVTAATFRHPGPLAIQVAQVDQMSGGRVEFGLGAGWFETEHKAYGIPFPRERHARLTEQLEIVTGLFATPVGSRFSYDGRFYTLVDAPALPKPAQSPLPVIIGGMGPTRTPDLAAKHADEFNTPFASPSASGAQFDRVRAALEANGRAADDIVLSSAMTTVVGKDDAEVARRAAAIGRDPAELRSTSAAGTPAEVVDTLGRYAEAGASRAYLQILDLDDLDDLDHLELIASEVRQQIG